MEKLDRSKLWSLEEYALQRSEFRAEVIARKRRRQLHLNERATLFFEDFATMKYQVQEMLRVERIFEPAEIDEEIATYNPLIPDGSNWKATFMIEYPDVKERRQALQALKGVEHGVWARVGDGPKLFAIANEDLQRSNEQKTAAVHFLRFELPPEAIAALKAGAPLAFGINHERLKCKATVSAATRSELLQDLD